MKVDIDALLSLPFFDRRACLRWVAHVVPDRWAVTAELAGEGKIRLLCLTPGHPVNPHPDWSAALTTYASADRGPQDSIVMFAIYTAEQPPAALLDLLVA